MKGIVDGILRTKKVPIMLHPGVLMVFDTVAKKCREGLHKLLNSVMPRESQLFTNIDEVGVGIVQNTVRLSRRTANVYVFAKLQFTLVIVVSMLNR